MLSTGKVTWNIIGPVFFVWSVGFYSSLHNEEESGLGYYHWGSREGSVVVVVRRPPEATGISDQLLLQTQWLWRTCFCSAAHLFRWIRLGYGAVAFLRLVDVHGRSHCAFAMSKAWLSPIYEITILRLELSAAVISVKLSQIIQEEFKLKIYQVNYWTDSTMVLKCLNNDTKRFHTVESNQKSVLTISVQVCWQRFQSYLNRSLNGPDLLWKQEDAWTPRIEIPVLIENSSYKQKSSCITWRGPLEQDLTTEKQNLLLETWLLTKSRRQKMKLSVMSKGIRFQKNLKHSLTWSMVLVSNKWKHPWSRIINL